jgi:hypothetical protein
MALDVSFVEVTPRVRHESCGQAISWGLISFYIYVRGSCQPHSYSIERSSTPFDQEGVGRFFFVPALPLLRRLASSISGYASRTVPEMYKHKSSVGCFTSHHFG